MQVPAHLSDDLKWFKRLGKREKAALEIRLMNILMLRSGKFGEKNVFSSSKIIHTHIFMYVHTYIQTATVTSSA